MKITIVLFSTDRALIERLGILCNGKSPLEIVFGTGPEVTASHKLDAFWMTWMQAERFGAEPPFAPHEARVLRVPASEREKGFPAFVVAGVLLADDDPNSAEFQLQLVLEALLTTVQRFNATNLQQIHRVGTVPENLALNLVNPSAARRIVDDIYSRICDKPSG
jgi:hypothetical protein